MTSKRRPQPRPQDPLPGCRSREPTGPERPVCYFCKCQLTDPFPWPRACKLETGSEAALTLTWDQQEQRGAGSTRLSPAPLSVTPQTVGFASSSVPPRHWVDQLSVLLPEGTTATIHPTVRSGACRQQPAARGGGGLDLVGRPADLLCADLPLRLLRPPTLAKLHLYLCQAARGSAQLEGSLLFPRPWDLHVLTQVVLTALTEGTRHREVKSRSRSPSKASSDPDLCTPPSRARVLTL